MRTPSVVKGQVVDDAQFCLVSGCESLIVQLFVFQAAEHALRRAVVPAVALPAHALPHAHGQPYYGGGYGHGHHRDYD